MAEPRDRMTRKAELLTALASPAADVWVATASPEAAPHLVPLSLAWIADRAVIALEGRSATARNLGASGVARLAVGSTRDVGMIDVVLERSVGVDDDASLGEAYAAQADWDPRGLAGYVFLVLRPMRIQAWRESNERAGRVLMRDGVWVV
ncbi:pyridoxamine 5'-phosphate oxidase family protein [Microbacterium ureisolvens]|uniref:Pyridoxamine 5'-phosphate oxidase family protein n=1 Tax=Microbacterium ureisolvens TaxID=2781186 RepID=A0ABS7HTY8_9MICO|nr:pyridoxamine 5'-phosphate oxidase family protein [Microbacterium ureisolvens]MBW9108698.1 pyridoxamine 5'-phosphate oxidase family protein [Microbacterium ureisolvens]